MKRFDPRACFMIQGQSQMYIWQGKDVPSGNLTPYMDKARDYMSLLQKHEKAPQKFEIVEQGSEGAAFWQLFFSNGAVPSGDKLYGRVIEWDKMMIDVSHHAQCR